MERISIGRLAKSEGLSPATLRYYEALGLIQSETREPGKARVFPARARQTLRAIARFQAMGFTLREVLELMRLPRPHPAHRRRFQAILSAKLAELERVLKAEQRRKKVLTAALERCLSRSSDCACDVGSLLGPAVPQLRPARH